jgi:hypothetical protein
VVSGNFELERTETTVRPIEAILESALRAMHAKPIRSPGRPSKEPLRQLAKEFYEYETSFADYQAFAFPRLTPEERQRIVLDVETIVANRYGLNLAELDALRAYLQAERPLGGSVRRAGYTM